MKSESEAVSVLKRTGVSKIDTIVMLGSGWNKVVEKVKVEHEISYSDLFGVKTSVPGHEGRLIIGKVNGKEVAFMAGRFHLYEGYSGEEATLPIRVLNELGAKSLVVTSASGGINSEYKVGDFVILNDLLTLFLKSNPLVGPKFQDMSRVFDDDLRKKAIKLAEKSNIPYREGVYMYVPGPHYETPADKKMAKTLGADCIGMSTVPETLQARNLGMKVLGLSFVTNLAFVKHDHKEVVEAANRGSGQMVELLMGVI